MEFGFNINFLTNVNYVKNIEDVAPLISSGDLFLVDSVLESRFFFDKENCFFVNGERDKTLDSSVKIIDWLISKNCSRTTVLWGVGGGAVTDLAGFCGSVYKRGLRVCLIPTTILAAVDSCFGGKNGVNASAKNVVGTFYPAERIVVIKEILDTLPDEEKRNGACEILKVALLDGGSFYDFLSQSADIYGEKSLMQALTVKYRFIKDDLLDKSGTRILLNFGHTIGHALERFFGLSHGKAVAYGMIMEQMIAEKKGLKIYSTVLIKDLLEKYSITLDRTDEFWNNSGWLEFVGHDKKIDGGELSMVYLEGLGAGRILKIKLNEFKYLMEEML